MDLLDTNDLVTAGAIYGNLLAGTGNATNRILEIPFAANPAATGIRLRKGVGATTIFSILLYVDADLDGLDAAQEAQLGTSDLRADTDGDGLSDYDEVFIHGTDPTNPDSDGDGIGDGLEVRMGLDPIMAGNYSQLPFTDGFEPAGVTCGELGGQNNWQVNRLGVAVVQSNEVFSGLQALSIADAADEDGIPVVRHLFANAPDVVWFDLRQKVRAAVMPAEIPVAAAFFLFNGDGHLVIADGHRPVGDQWLTLTNAPALAQGAWARVTVRLDYSAQTWLICLNGRLLADNLGFTSPHERFTTVQIEGQSAVMDDFHVGTQPPADISTVAGNTIPDAWYLQYFGSLGHADIADPDGDGLTNIQEYQLGANPALADTDGDTIPDGEEQQLGRDPLVADALSTLPFIETFEPPAVSPGDLRGQRNWQVNRPDSARVQTNTVFDGLQALQIARPEDGDESNPLVSHFFAETPSVVWFDIHQQVRAAPMPETLPVAAAFYLFNGDGHLVIADGHRPVGDQWLTLTNAPALTQGAWARVTVRLDYSAQTWLICLNGRLLADNLGFVSPRTCLKSVLIEGESGLMDNFRVCADQPAGISTVAGNIVPDEWYLQRFGSLGFADAADPDTDGLTNLQEYLLGTDPNNPDSDSDGADDAREAAVGSEPLDPLSYPIAMSGALTYAGSQTGTLQLVAESMGGAITNPLILAPPVTTYAVSNLISRRDYTIVAYIDTTGNAGRHPWEPIGHYSANPLVNPIADLTGIDITLHEDRLVDTDGDELPDYDEIYTHGSDPYRADTSGDGLPDGWLVEHGFDPRDPGLAMRDTDGDGLSNADEYQFGFDPNDGLADNDGDGLPDAEEIYLFGTSPLAVDTDGDGTNDAYLCQHLDGTNTTHRSGQWTAVSSMLAALANHHMRAEYTVPVAEAGMYRLAFGIANVHAQPVAGASFRFLILIDGIPVRWVTSPPFSLQPSALSLSLTTPWLTTGEHTIRLAWLDNYAAGKLLGIDSVTLQRVDGADNDFSGSADWEEWILDQGHDTDGDGLADRDELPLGLNPLAFDTDGDVLGDGEELNRFGSDPLVPDSDTNGVPDAVLLATRKGSATSYRKVSHITNVWKEDGDILYNPKSGILISYDFTVTNAGMHLIAFDLRNRLADPPDNYLFQIQVSVNGRALATCNVRADLDRPGTGRFITPWLTPGTHTISLKWLNDQDANGRYTTIAVEEIRLYAFDAPDADGDGIQDWQASALQSAGDTDGDGIGDYLEVTVHGTSPVLKDSDGDGIDDNVEIALGLDPTRTDTDGDGVTDWQELNETLTDPLIAEFDGSVIAVDQVNGADRVSQAGAWRTDDTAVVAHYRRGQVEYQMTCATGDIHFLEIRAAHLWVESTCFPQTPVDTSDLLIYIDDDYIGKRKVISLDGVPARIGVFTPWLAPGAHTVRLCWENTNRRLQLRIEELALLQLGGFDTDGNGVRDWVETYLSNLTSLAPVPATSVVSPVCIEGAARFVRLVSVAAQSGATNAPAVHPSITGRWYSNLALAPTGTTPIAVSFQNGALTRHATVTWTPLNLLATGGNLMIRQGDSLKLTATPVGATNGVVTIGVGNTGYTTDVSAPVIVEFPQAGNYVISGTYVDNQQQQATGQITLSVIGAAFPTNPPACMIGETRNWNCPALPAQAIVQSDSTVNLSRSGQTLGIRMTKVNRDHYVIARLGQNGPIMARQKLDGFWIQAAVDGYVRVVEKFGTYQIWEQNLVTKHLPPSVDLEISIFIGGVTFADDMTTTRWIGVPDLDSIGEYNFQLLHPNSVSASACHRIKAYANGLYLGEAYYSQILMPDE
jgi:hypothetical protein